ncbi:hypothetical protein [Bradyrhizobium sp.]|uniref:hypothetical protein n=1 Tax=Bradyrhizobium sp. TaxID=376 RepID=UPI0025BD2102|nr:hypothetical protein [Bradyrhizobium sp.]
MKTGIRPMEVQSKFERDDLRQYEIPARAGQSARVIVVEKVLRRSSLPVAGMGQDSADH